MSFFAELKRRNVYRVAVMYVIAAWLIMQVADVMFPALNLPDWAITMVANVVIIGFPIALIFSWIFEITPEGLKLEKNVVREESITAQTGRNIDFIIIGLLTAAVIFFAATYDWSRFDDAPPATDRPASIAVLAFTDMSADQDQAYFAEGLSDTLIHVLAQISQLKVTAKTSSFAYKDQNVDIRKVAEELGVATVLEGSVQKSGDRLRIIAQLIDASDGTHLWSGNFDRGIDDIFIIQDEIAQEVVEALKVALLDEEQIRLLQRHEPTLEAYELLLRGRQEVAKRTSTSLKQAEQHFRKAIEIDPDYALAMVNLGDAIFLQGQHGDVDFDRAVELAEPVYLQALDIDPGLGELHASLGSLAYSKDDRAGADNHFRRALELSPNYSTAYHWYALYLAGEGELDRAIDLLDQALRLDPLSDMIRYVASSYQFWKGDLPAAERLIDQGLARNPAFPKYYEFKGQLRSLDGELAESIRWLRKATVLDAGNLYLLFLVCYQLLEFIEFQEGEQCIRDFERAHPETEYATWAAMLLKLRKSDRAAAIKIGSEFLEGKPEYAALFVREALARSYFLDEQWSAAKGLLMSLHPKLFDTGDIRVFDANISYAVDTAFILRQIGQHEDAGVLIDEIGKYWQSEYPKMMLVEKARYLVLRNDYSAALDAMNQSIDSGLREGLFSFYFQEPILRALHDDPGFHQIVEFVESDLRRQQQLYEEKKDEPLF